MPNNLKNLSSRIVPMAVFCVGGGSKLLQSQLDKNPEIFSIPGYPLKYFYPHWFEWKKKEKELSEKKILSLLLKHHAPIIDSRSMPGNNGLINLGKNRNRYIKIPKEKFKKNFLLFLKNKTRNSKNVITAIHYAYIKATNRDIKKIKVILYHIHESEYFSKYFEKDFPKSKLIVCLRDPINYFWKRIKVDKKIEEDKFDFTDREYLKIYEYHSSLLSIFNGFKYTQNNFFNKFHFIKFEDLKTKNKKSLKKIGRYLKVKINTELIDPSFNGLSWWSDKSYEKKHLKTFDGKIYNYDNDFKNFFNYEIFILKFILQPFFKKVGYKKLIEKRKHFTFIKFIILIFFPTKDGIKKIVYFLNPKTISTFLFHSLKECFYLDKLKNYYFNAMYKFKRQYSNKIFLKYNVFKRIIFHAKSKSSLLIMLLIKPLFFLYKIFIYFCIPISLILLYFQRIMYLVNSFMRIRKIF